MIFFHLLTLTSSKFILPLTKIPTAHSQQKKMIRTLFSIYLNYPSWHHTSSIQLKMRTRLLIIGTLPLPTPAQDVYHKGLLLWQVTICLKVHLATASSISPPLSSSEDSSDESELESSWSISTSEASSMSPSESAEEDEKPSRTQSAWSFPEPPLCCNVQLSPVVCVVSLPRQN